MRKLDPVFAIAIFGEESLVGMGPNLRPLSIIVGFIGRVVANIWHYQAQRITRDMRTIKALEASLEKKWESKYLCIYGYCYG